jgi:hypothetical protein
MSKKPKGPKMAVPRPEEEAFLKRWKNVKSAPSHWEKMDKDPVYKQQVELRGSSLGTHWGIGRPKPPN